jgi:RHS repeat-associated protein
MTTIFKTLPLLLLAGIAAIAQPASFSRCDVNRDGSAKVNDVQSIINQALGVLSAVSDLTGDGTVNIADVQFVINAALGLGCAADVTILDFNPKSGPVGTLVTLTGNNLGAPPQVSLPKEIGGTIDQPLSKSSSTSVSFVIIVGSTSGPITVSNGLTGATTSSSFTVTASNGCSSTLLGDVNGDGVVSQADADQILALLSGSIAALTCPANADANQDGAITAADANVITARIAGTDRTLTLSLEGGIPGKVFLGGTIEVGVQELFFPFFVQSGTVRIQSASTGYDSQVQNMVFQGDGRSLYWHWQTAGLTAASDYQISVTLNQPGNLPPVTNSARLGVSAKSASVVPLTGVLPLEPRSWEPVQLSQSVDASAPAPGIPLSFIRSWTHDSYSTPAAGPFGLGWKHNFEIQIQEFTDGSVAFIAPGGVDRVFTANGGGTYTASPGDHGVLTLDYTGSFQLRETNGFLYRFLPNLLLDYMQDRNGNSITCAYDTSGHLVSLQHSSGAVFRLQYNTLGFVSVLTDEIGRQTQYAYDATGTHVASATLPDGTVTSYSYTQGYGVPIDDRLQVVTYPSQTHIYFTYDSQARFASSQLDGGASQLTYNYPAGGRTTITDAGGGMTSIVVNQHIQPTQVTDPDGDLTQYQYDASFNLIAATDPLGRTWSYSYDGNGNRTKAVDPAGNTFSTTYDPSFAQLTSFTDSRGNVTSFQLDPYGNTTRETYPDTTSQSFAYGQSGLLSSRTDAKGQTIRYTYAESGRLLSKTYPDQSSASYGYDAGGNLTSATDSSGTIAFMYDTGNRVTSKTYPGSRSLQYAYDSGGRRTQMTDADGQTTGYVYDTAGRLSQLLNNAHQASVSYQYDSVGRVSRKTLANGAYTQYTYDLASRLQGIVNYGPSASVISSFGYTYDAGGNVLTKTTIEGLERYTYDSLGQLTAVSYPNGTSAQYSYDSAGNRISSTEAGVQSSYLTNNLNQYQSVNSIAYSYDANGNLYTYSSPEPSAPYFYGYDFNNRLTQAHTASGNVSYTYNALGERSSRSDQSGSVQYLWDGFALAIEQTPANQTSARYTWGRALDEAVTVSRNGSTYYYTQDALMSVSDLLDATGHQAEHYTYSAFGAPSQTSAIGNPLFFTGARYDQAMSLYSFRARWYSPALGRFSQLDPIGLWGGTNAYTYAGNAPSDNKDPFGLEGGDLPWWLRIFKPPITPCTEDSCEPPDPPRADGACDFPFISNCGGPSPSIPQQFSPGLPSGQSPIWYCLGDLCVELPVPSSSYGGLCPTFIQISRDSSHADPPEPLNASLFGRIAVPVQNALLRSDIPIYGVSGGSNFKEYRVEYGEGKSPAKWTLIQSSTVPQPTNKVGLAEMQLMQGDLDLRGNLATWNTGLKEWVHLPWHPAEDPTDLRGEYTVRLVVTGRDGKSVEDRVNVEVGRVISQVLPGDAISTDNKVRMHFEAQSLQAPFRVYTIKPLLADVPAIPDSLKLVGPAYTIREPGDQFLKPVILRFDIAGMAPQRDPAQLGIYAYNPGSHQWEPLQTYESTQPNTLETSIYMLPDPVAYYAVLYGPGNRILPKAPAGQDRTETATATDDTTLVFDSFETDTGQWSDRDRAFGGSITRDKTSSPDGTYSLKITNQNFGGDFAVTAVSTPFRADTYPMVSFDYRIGPGIKTDFYVRIRPKWYRIAFTGDDTEFRNTGVGIASIGRIAGIVTDGQWHSAAFDLNRLLAGKTARRDVDEMIMADWRVGGYMKLEFGSNPRGASFYIDNFKIRRGEDTVAAKDNRPKLLLVDDFDGPVRFNKLGGAYDVFSDPGTNNVSMVRVPSGSAAKPENQALSLKYDVTRVGAYGGYWSQLRGAPGDEFDQVAMKVKSAGKSAGFLVGLKRKDGTEPKVPAERYWSPIAADGWREVTIPLAAFGSSKELADLDLLSISFTNALGHGKGELLLDNVRFERGMTSVLVADFEGDPNTNNLMQKNWIFTRGAAALAASSQRPDSPGDSHSLRLSYGGTIGLDLGSGDFSYAGWVAGLGGINGSQATTLLFRVRGQAGGERFNVYLDDGTTRKPLDTAKYVAITKEWKEVSIPLEAFGKQGVDLSHLEELQFVFEWQQMSGTLYVDDIRLTRSQPEKTASEKVSNEPSHK